MTVQWTVRAEPDRAPQCETSSPSTPAKKKSLAIASDFSVIFAFGRVVFFGTHCLLG